MATMNTYRKKLVEVALPLKKINEVSAREKPIRHGHPSTLEQFPTEEAQQAERRSNGGGLHHLRHCDPQQVERAGELRLYELDQP